MSRPPKASTAAARARRDSVLVGDVAGDTQEVLPLVESRDRRDRGRARPPRRRGRGETSTQALPIPDAAPVTSATSPAKSGGLPAFASFACSRSQYSMSKRSRAGSAAPAAEQLGALDDVHGVLVDLGGDGARPWRGRPAASSPSSGSSTTRGAGSSIVFGCRGLRRVLLEIARGTRRRRPRRPGRAAASAWCGSRGPASPAPAGRSRPTSARRAKARLRGIAARGQDQREARRAREIAAQAARSSQAGSEAPSHRGGPGSSQAPCAARYSSARLTSSIIRS